MALLCAVSVFAQTAEEIIARMDAVMDRNKDKGIVMTVDIGIPLLGTMSSRTWAKDDNIRLEAEIAGTKVITWSDSESEWIYSTKDNKVTITKLKISDKSRTSESEDSAEMLTGITEGYDVSIEKETPDAWHIKCRKSKSNKNKDDPKNMDLVISKADYYPLSLSAKLSGTTMTMHDIGFDFDESLLVFNPDDYPGVIIEDKR